MKLADKNLYKASIVEIRLKLSKLQELNERISKIRIAKKLSNGYKEVDRILHY